jgi:hypothetical protein
MAKEREKLRNLPLLGVADHGDGMESWSAIFIRTAAANYFQGKGGSADLHTRPCCTDQIKDETWSAASIRMTERMVSAQLNFRGPSKPAEEIRSGTVVLLDDGPGHLIDERRAADKAHPAAWTREFRWLSGRSDFTSTAIDVHGLLLFQCPTHLSRDARTNGCEGLFLRLTQLHRRSLCYQRQYRGSPQRKVSLQSFARLFPCEAAWVINSGRGGLLH